MKTSFSQIFACLALVFAGGLMLSFEVRAQQAAPGGVKKEHSQKVSEGMQKLKEYTDANNTPKALELLEELLKIGDQGDSFDQAQLNLYKGNLQLPLEDARVAIAPLEKVLDITSRVDFHPNLANRDIMGARKNLAIVYYVSLQQKDLTDAQKIVAINKSIGHLEEYFKLAGEPTADESYQYSSFLFTRATIGREADNVDLPSIRQAREAAQKGIMRDTRFRTDLWNLVLTAYQYEKNFAASAEVMELLLERNPSGPESVRFWQQLPGQYLQLANDYADKQDINQANEYRMRAILAYERAQQKAGLFTGDKGDDATMHILNLAKTYSDIGQIERGAEIMLEGVRAKKIKGAMNERAWLFVSEYYRQLGKEDKSIAVLKEAANNFPQDGQYDLQLANTYYTLEQLDNAINSIRDARRKGVPGKEVTVFLSESYYLYSANRFKEASEAAARGLALPSVPATTAQQLRQIKDAADLAEVAREAASNKL